MPNSTLFAARRAVWLSRAAALAAVFYTVCGVAALWLLSPRVPYGDQWRHYGRLLTQPFAHAVLAAENGHAEILPNLVRWIELHWCGGHETLQIVCAGLLALATLLVLLHGVARERALAPEARAAAALTLAFGVFWLGNVHALTVVTDAVHVYLVLLCVVLAAQLVAAARVRTFAICALCVVASFSFGSGLASIPALAVVLLMRGAFRPVAALIVTAAAIAALYLLLPAAARDASGLPNPVQATQLTAQVLGAPFVYLFWPLLDPAAANAVPGPMRGVALTAANFWSAHCGDIRTSVWPQAAFGYAMIAATLYATVRRARGGANASVGLVLAWFGIGCAVLIAAARATYFGEHVDQIYALRYLPWTCVGWSGLALAWIARTQQPRGALIAVLLLALIAIPSQLGLLRLAAHVRDVAEDTALDLAVGVLPADQALGETQLDDVRSALPALREAHTAMFAWREMQWLDQTPSSLGLTNGTPEAQPAANAWSDSDGVRLHAPSFEACGERVLAVHDGLVAGLLRRDGTNAWRGVARGTAVAPQWYLYTSCD